MAFMAAALLASCSDSDEDYSGDFGQIKVPDTRQLEQTVTADDTQAAQGDHESLQYVNSTVEEIHKSFFLSFCRLS